MHIDRSYRVSQSGRSFGPQENPTPHVVPNSSKGPKIRHAEFGVQAGAQ